VERDGAPSSELVDMDSPPTARPMEMEPEMIWEAICWMARRPEEQKRLQTEAAVVTGYPAARTEERATGGS
jgi:hypothetical protein